MNQIYGNVIYSYTRADALNDGVLVDLSGNFPEEARLYRYPVGCSAAVWSLVEQSVASHKHCNSLAGVVRDILWMSQKGVIARPDGQTAIFAVIITGTGRRRQHTLKAMCHAGDDMEPVVTIMLPHED